MKLIQESIDEAEAGAVGAGATAQPRKSTKRPFDLVIRHAYVYEKMRNILGPWAEDDTTTVKMKVLAEEFSPYVFLPVPKRQHSEPQPTQMLRFTNSITEEVFTNRLLVDTGNKPLEIELVNIASGEICTEAPSSLEVEFFLVQGDFASDDQKLRTCEALSPRNKAMMPLLVQVATIARKRLSCDGKFVVKLHNGRAVVRGKITDNSSWLRSRMFKLVARVVKGSYEGIRIKEALSEAFTVKESKLEARRKHENPSPEDPTWRLPNVGKKYHEILQNIGISTVREFLNKLESDPDGLKRTLGMQNSKWESTVECAKKCKIDDEDVNIFNFRGNEMGYLISPNHDIQPESGYIEDANLIYMGTVEQMAPQSELASEPVERFPSNTSDNGNEELIHFEGMGKHSTIHPHFTRLESDQWICDYSNYPLFMEDGDTHNDNEDEQDLMK